MAYVKQTWVDRPSKTTPINAARLNHMEEGIYQASVQSSGASADIYTDTGINLGRKSYSTNGNLSCAFGFNVEASGSTSFAHGSSVKATGSNSHAEGFSTKANGDWSHAEGDNSYVNGNYGCHAEGYMTAATGDYGSHSEGYSSMASGKSSHAEGYNTKASSEYQHVQGKYNVEDKTNTYAHIVGGGTSNTDRKNIYTLDWNGNAMFSGDVTNGNGITMNGLKSLIDALQAEVNALKTS